MFGRKIVKGEVVIKKVFTRSALIGAGLSVLCGLLLWGTPLGGAWENASYDSLFRFGTHSVTNRVVLVRMDNDSHEILSQNRDARWDRALHTQLLRKLTDDGARLVVFDVFFKNADNSETDAKLAEAMRQNGRVVLMAEVRADAHSKLESARFDPPAQLFMQAAIGCGIGAADPAAETSGIPRRHWPFYAPGEGDFHSLGWAAAQALGRPADASVEKQWLRYYGRNGPGEKLPYYQALTEPPGFFRAAIVFIGNWPSRPNDPGFKESDKFSTPYTSQTGQAVGGMEIVATTFLNLVNGDWLRRLPAWLEFLVLVLTGGVIGGGLCQLKPLPSLLAASVISLAVILGFVSCSYLSNYWFPWMVITGGQVPCALAWAWVAYRPPPPGDDGYKKLGEPFGEGAYGKVWVVRNVIGQLQALKEIKRAGFKSAGPYEREFHGIKNYKPVSNQHPGLLHIDHVNAHETKGCFFYIMELGDALDPDWERKGELYRPRDLANVCSLAEGGRLPVRECLRIGIVLLEALDFLHQHGLVHRDIKPSNIIFVNGNPKLADVGLVREASPDSTWVGTEFYMPPPPEPPGTKAADIYALGKVLYVISTGKPAKSFSELSTQLVAQAEFLRLNEIFCKAAHPIADQRYASAAEMLAAMRAAQRELKDEQTRKI